MNTPAAALLVAASIVLGAAPALAQTPQPAKPATTPAKKPPPPKPAPKPAAKAAATLATADPEQLRAAGLTYLGGYDCEFNQTVNVEPTPKHEGYVDVKHQKNIWTMKPVLSSTGALRLEDVKGRMLMLQVANKSMVMDTKIGQRVLDGCLHATQKAFVKPADQQGLGIEAPASAPKR